MKILAIVVVCFVGLGVLALGGMYYAVHKVKQVVVDKAASYGVDLTPAPASSSATARSFKTCELLSKDEIAHFVGQPIERAVADGESCSYFGPPGLSAQLAKEQAANTIKRAQSGADMGGAQIESTINTVIAGVGAVTNTGGEAPMLIFVYSPNDGKAQMTALGILNMGFVKSDALKGGSLEVPNLGDRALRLANLGLNVLKGDAILRIVPGPVNDPDNTSIAIARAALAKL